MLSICMITKNEKEKLNRCLESLKNYPLEVVIADTGSTDGTQEMLAEWKQSKQKQFSLVLGEFAWCDDFAAAKNYAVSLASNDTVFVLDSDEVIEELDLQKLEEDAVKNSDKLGRIVRKNLIEQNGQINCQQEYISRIFDRRAYAYLGSIHEQLVPCGRLSDGVYPSYVAPVVIWHDGYLGTPEQKKQKAQRNMELLRKELEEQGEDPYILYQLGKSCYMQGDYAKAAEYFAQGLTFDLNPKLEYVIDMVETYGYALLNAGRAQEALSFENIYEEFGNTADFRLLMGLIYMNNEMFDAAVEELVRATECANVRMQGANSFLAFYNAGVIRECLGDATGAAEFYRKCGVYAPAEERLKQLQ